MSLMARDDERDAANRYLVVVSRSSAIPRAGLQTCQKRDRRSANMLEFLGKVAEAALVEVCSPNEVVLLETRERCRVSPAKPKRAIRKHSLAVDHVAEQFLYAPLAFSVTEVSSILGNSADQSQRPVKLRAERGDDIAIRHA